MDFLFNARAAWALARSCAATAVASVVTASSVFAQTPAPQTLSTSELTLSDSYRLSLAVQPWHISQDDRSLEQRARARVADSWLADQPTIASGLRVGNREGLREYEIEISVPIATSTRRSLQVDLAQREASVYKATLAQQRLKLAGEVREAFWAVQLAAAEVQLARDEVARAAQLATDSARRTAAGDTARVDTLQAQTVVQVVTSSLLEAEARLEASQQVLRALVGDAAMRSLSGQPETRPSTDAARIDLREHPTLLLAVASISSSRAKLNEASSLPNAAPSVSFTLANERTTNSANATTARIGISFPFGGASSAAPRVAQANAELIEAQANEPLIQQQLRAEIDTTKRALATLERRIEVLAERARLAAEVTELFAKAYRLGELDLPTRLRAEGERASATLSLARARIEQKHAISRLNQSLGILP